MANLFYVRFHFDPGAFLDEDEDSTLLLHFPEGISRAELKKVVDFFKKKQKEAFEEGTYPDTDEEFLNSFQPFLSYPFDIIKIDAEVVMD